MYLAYIERTPARRAGTRSTGSPPVGSPAWKDASLDEAW
jgi:hypothetical protein